MQSARDHRHLNGYAVRDFLLRVAVRCAPHAVLLSYGPERNGPARTRFQQRRLGDFLPQNLSRNPPLSESVRFRLWQCLANSPSANTSYATVLSPRLSADGRWQLDAGARADAGQTPGAVAVEAVDLKDFVTFARRFDLAGADALERIFEFKVMGFPPHHCSPEGTEEAPFSPVRGFLLSRLLHCTKALDVRCAVQ